MAGGQGRLAWGIVAVWVVLCLVSFSASAYAASCASKGDTKCATTTGSVAAVAGSFAAVLIGISMFNRRGGGGGAGVPAV